MTTTSWISSCSVRKYKTVSMRKRWTRANAHGWIFAVRFCRIIHIRYLDMYPPPWPIRSSLHSLMTPATARHGSLSLQRNILLVLMLQVICVWDTILYIWRTRHTFRQRRGYQVLQDTSCIVGCIHFHQSPRHEHFFMGSTSARPKNCRPLFLQAPPHPWACWNPEKIRASPADNVRGLQYNVPLYWFLTVWREDPLRPRSVLSLSTRSTVFPVVMRSLIGVSQI